MASIQSVQWLRIGAESVTIIGSILLALAIDASWDSRIERAEKQAHLGTLQIQFDESLDLF
jgi:hypothetical protein